MNKKNLIILMIDGGRWDYSRKSKFYKKLKDNTISFSQSITYGPHTIAAMHAVFSGSYGTRTGTNSYWSTYNFRKDKFKTLTEYLKDQNYYTICDMINKLLVPKQGFDEFLAYDEQNDDLLQRHSTMLENMKKKFDDGQNFFAYLQFGNIHTGIMNEVLNVYDNFSEEYFDNMELNKIRYDKLFEKSSNYLEKILEKISSLGLDNESLILIMSDHGISVGEKIGERAYGAFCYDYTLRTFAYFLYPNVSPKEISQQVRTIDFMPTILDYLKIKLDSNFEIMDGQSLLPIINGETLKELSAFSESGNPVESKEPPEEPNISSIRTSNWKLIFNEYNGTKELYNLKEDPDEKENLIDTGLEIQEQLWNEIIKIHNKL
jgi:arylsulfatase A-like enzyme